MGILFVVIAALVIFAYQRILINDSQKTINKLREECKEIKIERDEARFALSQERKKNMSPPTPPKEDEDWFDGALSMILESKLGLFLSEKIVTTSTPSKENPLMELWSKDNPVLKNTRGYTRSEKKWSATGEADKAARMTNGEDMYGRPYNGH